MIRLFVYGTLKRGQRNYALMRGAAFLGRHRTEAGFSMHDLGGYPAVCRPGRRAISGELFAIDEPLLRQLDRFEAEYGLGGRIEIPTARGPAWMYVVERGACLGKPRIAAWR